MRVLSLFSGIGGMDLGLERAGMKTVAFCEIDPFCQKVLRKHWPDVPIHSDIRELKGEHVGPVDVICGGFPCQDISVAGKGAGIDGERSGLWREYARLVGELRPRFVIVENVAALLGRGIGRVLGDLASIGYDAEWRCISAKDIGAPHSRERVWVVAYPMRQGLQGHQQAQEGVRLTKGEASTILRDRDVYARAWEPLPTNDSGMVDGLPRGVDRIKSIGNAVVPQVVELIGKAIMAGGEG